MVLHRPSNVNKIVPEGRRNFSTETLDDFIIAECPELEKNVVEELQLLFTAFFTRYSHLRSIVLGMKLGQTTKAPS